MGEVYRAKDTRLDRIVAIKVLNSALSSTPDLKARFEREAKSISQLNHPNICTLYDVGHEGDMDFLVMEFLDGESLADRIKKRGALPFDDVVKIGSEIADALDKAHRAGIVHRDLKPGNVILTKTGAKLLDFGLAKPAEIRRAAGSGSAPLLSAAMTMTAGSPQHSPLTQQGTLVGTIQYMSPEQIQGMEADARSDIFALGAVLFEMTTGKRPFEGKSQIKVASAILEDEPPQIEVGQKSAAMALNRLIRTCLAKNPDERVQAALDVKLQLCWIAETPTTSLATPRWRRLLPSGAGAALLFAALFILFFFRSAAPASPRVVAYLSPPGDFDFDTTGDRGAPPAVSPDGTKLVFGAGGKLWLRQLDQESVRELEGSDDASFPFWSPDSKSIGFFQTGKLRTMDTDGGSVTTVCDARNARGGSWGAAGFILFAPTISSPIMKVSAASGEPQAVTTLKDAITTHRWPQLLPDGKHFLYFAASHTAPGGSDETGVYIGSIDGSDGKLLLHLPVSGLFNNGNYLFLRGTTLMAQEFDLGHLRLKGEPQPIASNVAYDLGVWRGIFSVADSGLLVYSGGDPGSHRLQWFGSNGKPEKPVAEPGHYAATALSPSGTRLAEAVDPKSDLWVVDLKGSGRIRISDDNSTSPVWSPDERRLVYQHKSRTGLLQIVLRAADGTGNERALADEPVPQFPTDWSPDGKFILYDRGDPGTSHVWGLSVTAGGKPFPVVQSESWDHDAHFSPDGKWIALTSRESGSDQVYITRFPSAGSKVQVSAHGGGGPRWSQDGKWIYFWNSAHNVLLRVAVSFAGTNPVFGAETPFINGAVYHTQFTDADYSLSRDGRVLVDRVGEQSARFTIETNWRMDTKK
jgi:serine/threonine protein kinase/Tol biopolymer transport system component